MYLVLTLDSLSRLQIDSVDFLDALHKIEIVAVVDGGAGSVHIFAATPRQDEPLQAMEARPKLQSDIGKTPPGGIL